MNLLESFKLAMKSVWDNKIRAILTMLGMIIGVASVIILVGLMQGVTNYVIDTFASMGTNIVTVSITNTDTRFVEEDDMYAVVDDYSDVFCYVSPTVSGSYTVKNGSTSIERESVTGVAEDYFTIKEFELSDGRFITYADTITRYNACVIGTYLVDELYDGKNPIGETLKIDGVAYEIVGIKAESADSEEGSDDDCVYIPYTNACRMSYSAMVSSYTFSTYGSDYIEDGEEILDNVLYEILKSEDLYTITSMSQLLDTLNSTTSLLSAILSGIAGISLVVAGIGIMNIMLVSVIERTKEIGIRKSLGARRKDIMSQFVIEAAGISTLGGVIGIILGSLVTINLGQMFGVDASPTLNSILLSFGVSVGIGIVFGYIPAGKASKLNPIDALRNE